MTRRSLNIRDMHAPDAAPAAELIRALGLSTWTADDLMDELKRSDAHLRVAESGRDLIGLLIARFVPGNSDEKFDAELYNIGVAADHRNSGVGRMLLDEFLNACERYPVSAIWLEVRRSNDGAMRFYEKFGFTAVAERPRFYADPVEDAIVYCREFAGLVNL